VPRINVNDVKPGMRPATLGEWIPTHDGIPLKSIDAALDKIHALVYKRDDTLRQISAWREAQPELTEILNDLELHLL